MNLFVFLGIFLIACGGLTLFSTFKGSGTAGVAKVEARHIRIVKNESGRFLYSEYEFTHKGEAVTAKCPNKTKTPEGEMETMYYDVAKDILSTYQSRRMVIIVGICSIVLGILCIYFRIPLSAIHG